MDNIGLDLHQRESQLCILTDDGEVIERRIRTTPERLRALLGGRPPARILLEASTESEWVARHLEALGHTVIVADPNFAPMSATRSGRVKTDRRDARTLADALRPAHRSAEGTGMSEPSSRCGRPSCAPAPAMSGSSRPWSAVTASGSRAGCRSTPRPGSLPCR